VLSQRIVKKGEKGKERGVARLQYPTLSITRNGNKISTISYDEKYFQVGFRSKLKKEGAKLYVNGLRRELGWSGLENQRRQGDPPITTKAVMKG